MGKHRDIHGEALRRGARQVRLKALPTVTLPNGDVIGKSR